MDVSYSDIAKMVDHSLLNPTLNFEQLENGCRLAKAYDVASVCILPYALKRCTALLEGSTVAPSTTIGFPHGGHTTKTKLEEASQALNDGGTELDMVVNISKVLSLDWDYVAAEIRQLTHLTHQAGAKIKVIFENCYLSDEQKTMLCKICAQEQVDWVKTSTGYGTGGAIDHDLRLMRANTPETIGVKAAGGVRTLERALEVRALGCSRFGCSRTREVLDQARAELGLEPIRF